MFQAKDQKAVPIDVIVLIGRVRLEHAPTARADERGVSLCGHFRKVGAAASHDGYSMPYVLQT